MKIATWNINSIRRRLPLLVDWLGRHQPDVLCLQETKVQDSEFPADALREAGYHSRFRGGKSYNGVAILTRAEPDAVFYGFKEGPDSEDVRVIEVAVAGIRVVNTYVPQGFKVGTEKYAFKLEWFRRVRQYFEERFDPQSPVVWTGDMNVAPEAIDVYHPDRRVNDPDFHIDSRNAYAEAVRWGFVDVFRKLYPERVQYTYWDYFRNALENNWGWRIDHIMATAPLAQVCRAADVDMELRRAAGSSDHTVMWAEFDWAG
ncbi:MAG: exodeoxyribonuclease III [Bryobacteraceae bacterium]